MKSMWQSGKILNIKETENGTILQFATSLTKEEILRYQTIKGIFADIKLQDERLINHDQRKKFYATVGDIAEWIGDSPEYIKELMKFWYCAETGQEPFSLSDCSLEVARELITFTLEFALNNDVPLTENAIERTEDISKYLIYCLRKEKCCVCGEKGINYTVNQDKEKMCLCGNHYDVAKTKGLKEFCELWKVFPIQFIGG